MEKGEHRTFDIYRDPKGAYVCKFFKKTPFLGKLKIEQIADGRVPGVSDALYFMVINLLMAFQEDPKNKIIPS